MTLFCKLNTQGTAYMDRTTDGNFRLSYLIGDDLSYIIRSNTDLCNGLQLLRLKIGCSKIVVHKRLNDIKITIVNDNTHSNIDQLSNS